MRKTLIAIPLAVALVLLIYPFMMYSGNHIMVLTSDSMLPTLKPNDIIISERVSINEIKEGDIITFDTHSEGIEAITHRVIKIAEIDDKLGLDTQGDHLDHPDLWTVYEEDLIGKVVEINPDIGILLVEQIRYLLAGVIGITVILLVKDFLPKKALEVKQLTCLRCGYQWFPRVINGKVKIPDTCPNKDCRSPYWQTKRTKKMEK